MYTHFLSCSRSLATLKLVNNLSLLGRASVAIIISDCEYVKNV